MGSIAVLFAAAAAALTLGASPAAGGPAALPRLSDEEAAACADELDVVLRRQALFEAEGASAPEIARRNAPHLAALQECRERHRAGQRRAAEQKADLEEVARRTGPDATEQERARIYREIRRERLASKPRSELSPEEKAELAEGTKDELAATHATLDDAHARDPAFMRTVHSALFCYETDRKAELESALSAERSRVDGGQGDAQRLYALRNELRQSEEVLARVQEASGGRGLARCASPDVALIAECIRLRFQGKQAEATCASEEIEQYVRFVK